MNRQLKYLPTFRLRGEEIQAVNECANLFGPKIIPMFEIITTVPPRRNGTFQQAHQRFFGAYNFKYLVDIPCHITIGGSITSKARDFLLPVKRSRTTLLNHIQQLSGISNYLVPVLSHDPNTPYVPGTYLTEVPNLRNNFRELAFRIQHNQQNRTAMFSDLQTLINPGEIVILDSDTSLPTNTALSPIKTQLDSLTTATKSRKIILRSALPDGLTNVGLIHGAPVAAIDNAHVITHRRPAGYDAFGDYVGIRKELPKTGGQISPGLVYYFWRNNKFLGFKGRVPDVDEFARTIVPTLISSSEWAILSTLHRANCPGCLYVEAVRAGHEAGRSQGMWKRVSMMHYLYTMNENL